MIKQEDLSVHTFETEGGFTVLNMLASLISFLFTHTWLAPANGQDKPVATE